MVVQLSHKEIIDFGNSVKMCITIPDNPRTPKEAELLFKEWSKEGWHCGIIYCYSHHITGRKYIGQTIHPQKRASDHRRSGLETRHTTAFARAIRKYGISMFSYEILSIIKCRTNEELHKELDEHERFYIAQRGSVVTNYGYNITTGGAAKHKKYSNSMSVDMFDLNGNYIKTHQSAIDAIQEVGLASTYEIHRVCMHKRNKAAGYLWAWHGELPVIPQNTTYIYAYDTNGQFVAEYKSIRDAAKALGKSVSSIEKAIQEKHRLAYNMYWRKYKTDKLPLSDSPHAVYAYNKNGEFVQGFYNTQQAAKFIGDNLTSMLCNAIKHGKIRKGYRFYRSNKK